MAAQNVGAGAWDRVSRIARVGTIAGLAITGCIALTVYALGDMTLRAFLPPGSDALPVAHHINPVVLWSFVPLSITFVLAGVVRATGAVWAPLIVLVISMYAVRLPSRSFCAAPSAPIRSGGVSRSARSFLRSS